MIYSPKEKTAICSELENARQNLKLLGNLANNSDYARVRKAQNAYNRMIKNR